MRAASALVTIAALAACSSAADQQLEAIKSARSVLSEWALVEAQGAEGRAQAIYVHEMRRAAKDQLRTASARLTEQPEATRLIDRVRAGTPDEAALKHAAAALEPLEKRLEAA